MQGAITAQPRRYHSLEFDLHRVEPDSLALAGSALTALAGARRGVETEPTIRPLSRRSLWRALLLSDPRTLEPTHGIVYHFALTSCRGVEQSGSSSGS